MKKKICTIMIGLAMAGGVLSVPSHAAIPDDAPRKPVDRTALMGLAAQFVDRIGTRMDEADGLMKHGGNPVYLRAIRHFDSLPDGEVLLLQIALKQQGAKGKPIKFANPVMAVKEGRDVMISLADFTAAADFPIKIDPDTATAEGWFIRENQTFMLNAAQYQITVAGKPLAISRQDMRVEDGDILVRSATLAEWFGFLPLVDPQTQVMNIETAQLWPVQEKLARDKRKNRSGPAREAEQPYVENPYQLATVPSVYVNMQQRISKPAQGPEEQRSNYSVIGTGDLLNHSSEFAVTGDNENALSSVYLTLSRSSEEPVLLGPLKARHYEFNDIDPVRVPYANNASREQGFRATNKNPYSTLDSTTVVDGFTQPGWDVELYRDQLLVGVTTADESGFYSFEDVILFAGENKFRVLQFGPQGQIKEDESYRNVALSGQAGTYDFSASLQNTRTYNVQETNDVDKNTPHLAGIYETYLNDLWSWRLGASALEQHGDMNIYAYSGLATAIDETLVNLDFLVTDSATFNMAALARRRLQGGHSVYARAEYGSEGFTANPTKSGSEGVPSRYSLSTNITGPLWHDPVTGRPTATYFGQATYLAQDTGYSNKIIAGGIGTKLGDVATTMQMSAGQTTLVSGDTFEEVEADLSFSGRFAGFTWRTSSSYELVPELRPDVFTASLSKKLTRSLQADARVRHTYEDSYTVGSLGVSWFNDHIRVTPFVSYDSDSAIEAKIGVGFGLSRDPASGDIRMSSRGGIGGGVSAHIFLDKDGDGVYSTGDEPLKDVMVKAEQLGQRASSNEEGRAFLSGLSGNRITDIQIYESSDFDMNWVSASSGVSLRARPGTVMNVDFPILRGGSIDGTFYIAASEGEEPRTAENVPLFLMTPSGEIAKDAYAAYDGFYTFEQIRPGVYYLVADAPNSGGAAYMVPRRVVITPEGEALYGQDVIMQPGYEITYDFRALNAPASASRKTRVQRPDEIGRQYAVINIGPYYSDVMTKLTWYKMSLKDAELASRFNVVNDKLATPVDVKDGRRYLSLVAKDRLSIADTGKVCEAFIDAGYPCRVEIVTEYKQQLAGK